MIAEKEDFTPYQIAKYNKSLVDNISLEDAFNELIIKLKMLKNLDIEGLGDDLSYAFYLYLEELEDTVKSLELRSLNA